MGSKKVLGKVKSKTAVVKHKLGRFGNSTECGRSIRFGSTIKTNKTWKGVTCQKCLAVKAKADRNKAAMKSGRTRGIRVGAST